MDHCLGVYIAAVALSLTAGAAPALACACCSQTAQRYVNVEKLDTSRLAEIEQVAFAPQAKLMLGEADGNGIEGVDDPSEDYRLEVTRSGNRIVFSFTDGKGRAGSLVLAIPARVSIFEVDPRDSEDTGAGPPLYKEWKLTTDAAGDGLFAAVTGAGQRMTLVLHGRGYACTSYDQFTHWTLLVYGKTDSVTLYGTLDSAGR